MTHSKRHLLRRCLLLAAVGATLSGLAAAPALARGTTTTALSLSNTAPGPGETITLTATVTSSVGLPVGAVRFTDGGIAVGPDVPVTALPGSTSSGTATIDTAFIPGTHILTATFLPTDVLALASSASPPQTITVRSNLTYATDITVTASPAVIETGNPVTLTAHVVRTGAAGIPTGTVTFDEHGTRICESELDADGLARCVAPSFLAGSHTITVSYLGTIVDRAAQTSITINVTDLDAVKVQTVTDLTVVPNAIRAGDTVTFKAVVHQLGTQMPPIGTNAVTFTIDGIDPHVALLVGDTATIQLAGWVNRTTPYLVRASYFGDVNSKGSSDTELLYVLPGKDRLGTSLAYGGDVAGVHGESATLAATLTDSQAAPVTGATLRFTLGGTTCQGVTGASGLASCTVTLGVVAGAYTVAVAFDGDLDTLASSTSSPFAIAKAPSGLHVAYIPGASTSTLAGTLTDSRGAPLAGRTVTLALGGFACLAATNAQGVATCAVTTPPGTTAILSGTFAGDASYLSANASTIVQLQIPTQVVYTGATTADYDDQATLGAQLSTAAGAPVAGKTVTLSVGGAACSALTDANGDAACTIVAPGPAGTYTVTASFAGEGVYLASADLRPFTVTLEQSALSTTAGATTLWTPTTTLSATLLEDGVTPIAGRSVTLTLGGVSCLATTDALGRASCSVATPTTLGPAAVSASFAGDRYYLAASSSRGTLLYANAPGTGSFVIGDRSTTGTVTFWGSDWWKLNTLSTTPAPSAFKGYALFPGTPACGAAWSTDPGNSTPPPAAPLPAYMAVLVASAGTKTGSLISGTTVQVVVVRTDAGYDGNPGHPGTGTVVATVC